MAVAVLLALAAAAAVLGVRPKHATTTRTTRPTSPQTPLRPGQTEVAGTIATARLQPADHPALPLPLTMNVAQRGVGGATIANALVGGQRQTIVWDGGTPLVLQGTGSLDVAPAPVEVSAAGVRWSLDGHPNLLAAGRYTLIGPVAAGAHGLAAPRDRVDFAAADGAGTGIVTNGGVTVLQALTTLPIELTGPGRVELDGNFTLRTSQGTVRVAHADFAEGAFQLTFALSAQGISVSGVVQGSRGG
jgi:hypothetical protein